ncbi:hypothetical protein HHK36_025543 [Tetracentron sinense]|uniref:Phosphorylated adapter RNA export protein n=1 Tax=Tetracentron sinense TaxID=13715 RepID=A0A835D5N0_TETSI|nr:hypothetical protein HHK36_025543 [Tetracentron sinense]
MEGEESILEAIYEDENVEDFRDVDMLDVEEGECVEQNSCIELAQDRGGDVNVGNEESHSKSRRRRAKNKKKKNKKMSGSGSNITDINRFVLDTCRRLKEKKSYLIWNAVGCLGISALNDLVKEVDAIQACGGQMTADGRRPRIGGGILWSILKTRDPKAYKEIMTRGKEFEKQFRQQNIREVPEQNKEPPLAQKIAHASSDRITVQVSDSSQLIPQVQNGLDLPNTQGVRISVHNRIRRPVTYDDLLGEDLKKDEST